MKTNQRLAVTKERQVNTYAELWHTSRCLLEKGVKDPKGSAHQFRASLVFTAFTLEAALNHIGPKLFKCWRDLERLGPRAKLSLLAERLEVALDYGKQPWQVLTVLFSFRNKNAHGKSELVCENEVVPLDKHSDEEFGSLVRTDWEEYCTQENAEKARKDVEEIVQSLYQAGHFENDYPFIFGSQFGSATVTDA